MFPRGGLKVYPGVVLLTLYEVYTPIVPGGSLKTLLRSFFTLNIYLVSPRG